MPITQIPTKSLVLKLLTREETLSMVDAMSPVDRAEVSDEWLAALRASDPVDPWRHGFVMIDRETGHRVGNCAFKGPPSNGVVEIAYGVEAEFRGRGYASEAAEGLTNFAFSQNVPTVYAHTLSEANASTRILTRCGFHHVGEVIDPNDGPVWRWEKQRDPATPNP